MAIYTQLSPTALPGRRYSFSAKTAAPTGGPHTGTFTELGVIGVPSKQHSFSAKSEAGSPSGPHAGLFTELSVFALTGQRHLFSAKTEAVTVTPPRSPEVYLAPRRGGGYIEPEKRLESRRDRILLDDDELLKIAAEIVMSGILE
jgi:hypothetical protein